MATSKVTKSEPKTKSLKKIRVGDHFTIDKVKFSLRRFIDRNTFIALRLDNLQNYQITAKDLQVNGFVFHGDPSKLAPIQKVAKLPEKDLSTGKPYPTVNQLSIAGPQIPPTMSKKYAAAVANQKGGES